jgi:hypothetical protein
VYNDFFREFDFCLAAQRFFQNSGLDGELVVVGGVLVAAPAATLEILTLRLGAIGRCGEHVVELSACEAGLLLGERGFDNLVLECEGNEDGFAAAVRVGRQPSEAIAAVDQFFDSKRQEKIVRERATARIRAEPFSAKKRSMGRL